MTPTTAATTCWSPNGKLSGLRDAAPLENGILAGGVGVTHTNRLTKIFEVQMHFSTVKLYPICWLDASGISLAEWKKTRLFL